MKPLFFRLLIGLSVLAISVSCGQEKQVGVASEEPTGWATPDNVQTGERDTSEAAVVKPATPTTVVSEQKPAEGDSGWQQLTNFGDRLQQSNPDSSDNIRIVAGEPAWSPDARKIAFSLSVGGIGQIFTMNADGSDLRQLTQTETSNTHPAWSLTNRIAFVCESVSLDLLDEEVCMVNADGSNLTQLTDDTGGTADSPAWSPDGTQLVFSYACGIFVMDVKIGNIAPLITHERSGGCSSDPVWAPDGTGIAFVHYDGESRAIYVLDLADGTVRPITDGSDYVSAPSWSPDGTQIAYEVISELRVINADGTAGTAIGEGAREHPSWSPKGDRIAFSCLTFIELDDFDARLSNQGWDICLIDIAQ